MTHLPEYEPQNFNSHYLDSPYLKKQLIAYIGNKRRLLGFLADVFRELESRFIDNGGTRRRNSTQTESLRFGDCFAGSGSVSRLAKTMGFSVAGNDWELYSQIINTAHLKLTPAALDKLFEAEGGITAVLSELNNLPQPALSDCYISRYYAPAETSTADYKHERLFYTRENALFIDAVRNYIEQRYPGWDLSNDDFLRKCVLVAPLLYQAATHANTNGVFKAYHKGFGGHGGDALTRILAPMRLQLPLTIDGNHEGSYDVERLDAFEFAAGKKFDICYLDPPYNQHQYGSNYFMLNTIALWDKPDVPMDRGKDGRLSSKAGIRPDWAETRSGFCYSKSAPGELRRLIENIDARYIVLSYNTEGIIPFDKLVDILSEFGKTEIFCRDYIVYRGGRQSLARANRNVEFQLVLSRGVLPGRGDRIAIDRILKVRSIISMMNESFVPERIISTFGADSESITLVSGVESLTAGTVLCYRFNDIPDTSRLSALNSDQLDKLIENLEYCRCNDKREEVLVLMKIISDFDMDAEAVVYRRLWHLLLNSIRKFAFRKYQDVFEIEFKRLVKLIENEKKNQKPGNWKIIDRKITELRRVADLRLNG